MMVPEQIFESRLREMPIKGREELGRVSHVCLKPSAKIFFLSSETMRNNPDFVAQHK